MIKIGHAEMQAELQYKKPYRQAKARGPLMNERTSLFSASLFVGRQSNLYKYAAIDWSR